MPDPLHELVRLVGEIHDAFDLGAMLHRAVGENLSALVRCFEVFVFSTGDPNHPERPFSQAEAIARFEPMTRAVANTALALVAVWGSYRIMWGHGFRNLYQVRILLPRLLLAVALVNFALPLYQAAIDISNALSGTVMRAGITFDVRTLFFDWSRDAGAGPGLTLLTTAALFCGYLLLALAYVIRYALLVVLAILAPLAGLLFVLPETHRYAREWVALFVSTLFMQPLQLLIISIGFTLEGSGSWPIRHAFALAALVIAFKVPGALHSASTVGSQAQSLARRKLGHYAHLAARAAAAAV